MAPGSTAKLNVYIDFGVTYSAARWTALARNYPGGVLLKQQGKLDKFPTTLGFHPNSKVLRFVDEQNLTEGEKTLGLFKLLLLHKHDWEEHGKTADMVARINRHFKEVGCTEGAVTMTATFIAGILRQAVDENRTFLSRSSQVSMRIVVGYPARFGPDSLGRLQRAVKIAGDEIGGGCVLMETDFVQEHEAAGAQAKLDTVPEDGKPREPTIVVDCGGMTIDGVLCGWNNITESKLGGGIYMDHLFETELEDVIQKTMKARGLPMDDDIMIGTGWFVQLWKERTKLIYAGDGNDVAMPPLTLQDNIQVILHDQNIRDAFDPTIGRIVDVIQTLHRRGLQEGIDARHILLTGGLAQQNFITSTVASKLRIGQVVMLSCEDPWHAVVRGLEVRDSATQ